MPEPVNPEGKYPVYGMPVADRCIYEGKRVSLPPDSNHPSLARDLALKGPMGPREEEVCRAFMGLILAAVAQTISQDPGKRNERPEESIAELEARFFAASSGQQVVLPREAGPSDASLMENFAQVFLWKVLMREDASRIAAFKERFLDRPSVRQLLPRLINGENGLVLSIFPKCPLVLRFSPKASEHALSKEDLSRWIEGLRRAKPGIPAGGPFAEQFSYRFPRFLDTVKKSSLDEVFRDVLEMPEGQWVVEWAPEARHWGVFLGEELRHTPRGLARSLSVHHFLRDSSAPQDPSKEKLFQTLNAQLTAFELKPVSIEGGFTSLAVPSPADVRKEILQKYPGFTERLCLLCVLEPYRTEYGPLLVEILFELLRLDLLKVPLPELRHVESSDPQKKGQEEFTLPAADGVSTLHIYLPTSGEQVPQVRILSRDFQPKVRAAYEFLQEGPYHALVRTSVSRAA